MLIPDLMVRGMVLQCSKDKPQALAHLTLMVQRDSVTFPRDHIHNRSQQQSDGESLLQKRQRLNPLTPCEPCEAEN